MQQSSAAQQQQALMNQAAHVASGMDQQMRQITGMGQDPLSGVPNRNVPYWQAMYGNLGMGGGHLKGGK
jgi:hypothetical protein